MSEIDNDGWTVDETITLIGILKSLKELNGSGKVDWQHVANEMVESSASPNGHNRTISELRKKFKKLRNEYFTEGFRNGSCQYYNYLKDLLKDELASRKRQHETEDEEIEQEQEPELDEDIKVEPQCAQSLLMEFNGDTTNHPSLSNGSKMPLRCKWAEGEVEALLNIILTHKLQAPLLRKRNAKVFKLLAREMAKRNFFKSPSQLRVKYHQLRRQYAKAKNSSESFEHFEEMHALLNAESSAGEGDSDTNESVDEDGDMIMGSDSEPEDESAHASMPSNARVKWANGEVDVFLEIIKNMGLQSALLRKRNAKIFRLLSREMAKRSFDKAPEKLRIKYQHLRRQYNKAKNSGTTFEHFEAMHKLLNPVKKSAEEVAANYSSLSESDYIYSDDGDEDACKRSRQADTYFWTDDEVDAFLCVIKEQNLFRALDGSKKRNFKTLAHISKQLAKQSYQRTPHQLRNKLRLLMRRYREVQKDGLQNVRLLPRHYEMLSELIEDKRSSNAIQRQTGPISATAMDDCTKPDAFLESDSDGSSSMSSCDLFRAVADDSDNNENSPEPTPLELLTSINDSQKKLLAIFNESQERYLRQQRQMQSQFLQQLSSVLRQEREQTFRMLKDLLMQDK